MKTFLFIGGLVFFASIAMGRYTLGASDASLATGATPAIVQTPAAPTAVATLPPVLATPIRVNFTRGSYGATLTGAASTTYLLWAAQGQTFTTTLSSHSTALVSLTGPDGKLLYDGLAAGYTAAANLPGNGDYSLEVRTRGAYTMGVEIR